MTSSGIDSPPERNVSTQNLLLFRMYVSVIIPFPRLYRSLFYLLLSRSGRSPLVLGRSLLLSRPLRLI